MADIYSCLIDRTQGFQQWSFIVQRLTGISDEYSRDAQCVIYDKDRRRRVPCTITTSLESISNTTIRERRSIRFLLYQQFSGKFFHHSTFSVMFYKSIVLFGGTFRQRLKPVCIMCNPQFAGPTFHTGCYFISNVPVHRSSIVHSIHQTGVNGTGQILEHLFTVEHVFTKIFTRSAIRNSHWLRLGLKRLLNDTES